MYLTNHTYLKSRQLKQKTSLLFLLVFLSVDFLALNVIEKLFSGSLYAESQTTIKVNKAQAKVFFDRALSRNENDNYWAISDFTEAIRINPQYGNAFLLRGINKNDLGDYYGAIADFTEAIRVKSDYISLERIYRLRGMTKGVLGDLNGAIADFTEAIHINPKYSDVYFERGMTKRILGDVYGAISDFTEAIRFNSQSGDAYFNRGRAKLTLGDRKEAFSDFANANMSYYGQGETKKLEKLSQFLLYNSF
jgi:tetratricopeptide (TPR) repeat protein